jgi:hypothetical protein
MSFIHKRRHKISFFLLLSLLFVSIETVKCG